MQPHEVGAGELLANLSVGYIVLAALVLTGLRLLLVPARSPAARSAAELVESLLVAGVLVFLIIRPFFLQAFYIPSESMEPTLQGHDSGYDNATGDNYTDTIHDHIFVNKLAYRIGNPKPGDIIVFRAPKVADKAAEYENRQPVENVLIKRLIGVPGDTIWVKQDAQGVVRVYRNGKPLDTPVCNTGASNEPCIKEPMDPMRNEQAEFAVHAPLKLGKDEYFVMGDNRNHSNDGRFWGVLKGDRIIGKAAFIFWPLSRIRLIR